MWGSRPFDAGEPGCRRQVLAFWVEFKGALVGSVARWPLGGIKIHNSPRMPQRNVDVHGNNLTAITGSTGDHSRSLHNYMLQFVAIELERIGAKYLAAKKGYKSTAGIFTHVLQPLLGTVTADKAFKLASFRISSLTPVAQDSASSWSLWIHHVWMASRVGLTSRAWVLASHKTMLIFNNNRTRTNTIPDGTEANAAG